MKTRLYATIGLALTLSGTIAPALATDYNLQPHLLDLKAPLEEEVLEFIFTKPKVGDRFTIDFGFTYEALEVPTYTKTTLDYDSDWTKRYTRAHNRSDKLPEQRRFAHLFPNSISDKADYFFQITYAQTSEAISKCERQELEYLYLKRID